MNVCAVIPALNEAEHIADVVAQLKAQGVSVLVVDDGSSDGTAVAAEQAGATVIRHDENLGKGRALASAFHEILSMDCDVIALLDGDGQHDPADLPALVEAIESSGADVVVGNRLGNPVGMPWLRRTTNRVMSWLLSCVCGQPLQDSQCGYRVLTRRVVEQIKLDSARFEVESELLLQVTRGGGQVHSVPVRCIYANERSHIHPVRDTVRFLVFLWRAMRR